MFKDPELIKYLSSFIGQEKTPKYFVLYKLKNSG